MRYIRARRLLWLIAILAGTSTILSACGQNGDLYLPEKPQTQEEQDK